MEFKGETVKMGRKLRTHRHGFEGRNIRESSWYDDGILDSSKMRHVLKGRRKELHLREFNKEHGDLEGFYRSVAVLANLWNDKEALAASIVALSDVCVTLVPNGGMDDALNSNYGVWTLDGVNVAGLAAWAAICWIRGADLRDCQLLINHEEGTRMCLVRMFQNFEGDDPTKYDMKYFRDLMKETEKGIK